MVLMRSTSETPPLVAMTPPLGAKTPDDDAAREGAPPTPGGRLIAPMEDAPEEEERERVDLKRATILFFTEK